VGAKHPGAAGVVNGIMRGTRTAVGPGAALARSRAAARPSSANGGSSIAPSPIAWRKPATACSASPGCRRANGVAREQRMRSSGCTRSSSGGSRRRPCCLLPKLPPCCSGHCSPPARLTCVRLMAGRRSPKNPAIRRLTWLLEEITSSDWRSRHTESQHNTRRHPVSTSTSFRE
jgi:hypothetical protein